mmetsp:Transcript_5/g.20  ORF Transcript_5/g.20 Transcript_5/m.20 type:complete len:216 (+) Transcript_5:339-986(+)
MTAFLSTVMMPELMTSPSASRMPSVTPASLVRRTLAPMWAFRSMMALRTTLFSPMPTGVEQSRATDVCPMARLSNSHCVGLMGDLSSSGARPGTPEREPPPPAKSTSANSAGSAPIMYVSVIWQPLRMMEPLPSTLLVMRLSVRKQPSPTSTWSSVQSPTSFVGGRLRLTVYMGASRSCSEKGAGLRASSRLVSRKARMVETSRQYPLNTEAYTL